MSSEPPSAPSPDAPMSWAEFFGTLLPIFIGAVLGFIPGCLVGLLTAEVRKDNRWYQQERALVEPILAGDPAFKDIECRQRSSGGVYLDGTVPKQADLERLRERLTRAVGESRANEIIYGIQFRQE